MDSCLFQNEFVRNLNIVDKTRFRTYFDDFIFCADNSYHKLHNPPFSSTVSFPIDFSLIRGENEKTQSFISTHYLVARINENNQ